MRYANTDEFLAIKFPGIRKSWLKRICERLKRLKQENGGNAEMTTHWSKGRDLWTDWKQRDISPD